MPNDTVDRWLDAVAKEHRPILDQLRELVLDKKYSLKEEFKWSRPCYSNADGLICYLAEAKAHVTIGFHYGTSLDDPKQLLEGIGKDMRHIKVRELNEIDKPALRRLIKQASEHSAG